MTTITIHESKALYAALEDPEALKQGPVFLEKDGQPTAVLFSIEEYRKLTGERGADSWTQKMLAELQPEIEAFQRLLPELLKEHRGEWVAIHNGEVLEISPDHANMSHRLTKQGIRPLLIREIREKPRVVDLPHLERVPSWETFDEWRVEQLRQLDSERAAFARLLPNLLKTHSSQFVAVHAGQVVEADPDKPTLVRRIRELGYKAVYIHKVTRELRIIEAPAPEVIRRA